jgi:hypothetical protein
MRSFIGRQEMMVVATFDESGERDCTFRAGPPGFVRVLDVNRLAWAEYPDDANCGSVTDYPEVSLAFLHYRNEGATLRLEGRAKMMPDELMRRAYRDLPDAIPGMPPEHWVTVYVEDVQVV